MKIKNSEVESTPVAVLQVTKAGKVVAELRQFWTAKSGLWLSNCITTMDRGRVP